MIDSLKFKIITPKRKDKTKVVEIYINEIELIDIVSPIEIPFATKENHPELAGDYEHQTMEELYYHLTKYSENVELLCCKGCGFAGCWSITINIEIDDKYVYWKGFKNNHRDWEYNISYKFDRVKYENELKQLYNAIEKG